MKIDFNRGNREIIEAEFRVVSKMEADRNFSKAKARTAYEDSSQRQASRESFQKPDSRVVYQFNDIFESSQQRNFKQKQASKSYTNETQTLRERLNKLSSEIRDDLDKYDSSKSFPGHRKGLNYLAIA